MTHKPQPFHNPEDHDVQESIEFFSQNRRLYKTTNYVFQNTAFSVQFQKTAPWIQYNSAVGH